MPMKYRGNLPKKRGFTRKESQDELAGPISKEEAEDAVVDKLVWEESSEGPDSSESPPEEN